MIAYLAIRQKRKNRREQSELISDSQEKVSIIIPAYNEEVTVLATIKSLLHLDYPAYELIFVDDGSKDKTFEIVNADTQLKTDALRMLMKYFNKDQVAAVAGSVKVGNVHNMLTHWQSIEYITSQNMDRRAFDLLNMISVVPGAIGAFRRSVILEVGGFTTDTLAEDCDLTMRILKAGYTVRNSAEAVAFTEAPDTVKMLFKQRFRWSFGVLQSFWKNKDTLLNPKYGYFGMVGMPNILIFQIILPLFAPLADLFMLFSLVSGLFSLSEVNGISWTGSLSDETTPKDSPVVEADLVYTFQSPKLALLMPENRFRVKAFHVLDIGLTPTAFAQTAVPETMVITDPNDDLITQFPDVHSFQSIGIGIGMGTAQSTIDAFKMFIAQGLDTPLVLDADALNILAQQPELWQFSITGTWQNDFQKMDKVKAFAAQYQLYVLIKGANSALVTPEGVIYFNSTGNVGMATGGSGDILTGILTALIGQGYSSGKH
ncbi:glycosyltransferase like family 2 domain-containing protein [Ditylenchus destructor]|uniref:ATP-dependent NAD(P)H-hydrate dehydratase n=1 Tax=Ditylenchus destructor TaxID=166010 RepID=A0AAD4MFQ5_9BILA|nr:glycosyltransferase like family 2 domain-containing protein [Ditylenchus destructor]